MAAGRSRPLVRWRPRASSYAIAGWATLVITACPSTSQPVESEDTAATSETTEHPACVQLRTLTERAQSCRARPSNRIPSPEAVAQLQHDECAAIMRAVVKTGPAQSKVRSIYAPADAATWSSVTSDELARWRSFRFTSTLEITPDLAPRPGRPQLEAFVDGVKIRGTRGGSIQALNLTPGAHSLTLRHAGDERTYCLTLTECDVAELRAHGASLAPSGAVRDGTCAPSL